MEDTHIAIFPSPGTGYLIPLTELAHRLIHLHRRLFITFIIPSEAGCPIKPQHDIFNSMPENISSIFLPPIDLNDLPEDTSSETRFSLTLTRSLPALRETLARLTRESTRKKLSAFVVDIFGPPSFEIAKEFDIPAYISCTVSAMTMVSIFHIPILDRMFSCEYKDLPEPINLPGCVPVHGSDLPEPLQDRKSEAYMQVVHLSKMFNMSKGVLINSFLELEPATFKALEEGEWCKPDIYPVGPLIRTGSGKPTSEGFECLKWLDKHPVGSVLYVSFGSGGMLSQKQLHELAFGLERSCQRFLWAIKSPDVHTHHDPIKCLPDGFLGRVKGRGLVVSSWAPQVEILGHGSIGGFLTHCGWNSILESIVKGVPMIAWPLNHAEERMNAVLLADGLGVGCRVKMEENGEVGRDEICKYVRSLMGEDGHKMRCKIRELSEFGAKALSQDGSSTRSLLDVIRKWMK